MKWAASWIWSKGATRKPFDLSYFRKELVIKKAVARARILCATDSKYRLWVDGKYIGFGPARGRSEYPYSDTHVVPPRAGRNTIAFLAQHNTKPGGIFASEEDVVRAALADANVQRHTQGKTVRKTIYAQKRILNIVVG